MSAVLRHLHHPTDSLLDPEGRPMHHARAKQDGPGGLAASSRDWLVWQLADSAFPTGGFAHSAGLEAAWQHGEIRNGSELAGYLDASLNQAGRALLPFVSGAHRDPERLRELDLWCDAFLTNHVANRASRLQGKAWMNAAERIFVAEPPVGSGVRRLKSSRENEGSEPPRAGSCDSPAASQAPGGAQTIGDFRRLAGKTPHAHFAPIFGAFARAAGLERPGALRLFLFLHLRSLISAAVRLGIIGPMEGQAIQLRLAPAAERTLLRCAELAPEDAAQTSPLHDLWQGGQDRLYSRLFQS